MNGPPVSKKCAYLDIDDWHFRYGHKSSVPRRSKPVFAYSRNTLQHTFSLALEEVDSLNWEDLTV